MSSQRKIAIGHVETAGSNLDSVHANSTDAANGTTSTNTRTPRATHGLPLH